MKKLIAFLAIALAQTSFGALPESDRQQIKPRSALTNGGFENGKVGYSAYADAAATTPVDGTGGSPTVTITTSTTSPLIGSVSGIITKDAANRQGEGVSIPFTIPTADQAKVMQISFDYLVGSGTFSAGSSSTDSDIEVYVYDVTNAQLIQPSTYKLYGNPTSYTAQYVANFQTAYNSTSYRLIFHCATTSASAYTLKLDNIAVAATQYVYGTPITDWISYGSTASYTGFGTVSSNTQMWRRVGDTLEVQAKFTVGTTSATEARLAFPSGLVASDTSKIPSIQVAGEFINGASSANHGGAVLAEPSVSYFTFDSGATYGSGTFNALTKQPGNNMGLTDSSSVVTLKARVPVQGWSSAVQMSDSADTRVVSFSGTTSSTQAVTSNTTNITYTAAKDTHGAWSGSVYTAPVPGDYIVAHMRGDNGSTTQNFRVYVNGTFSRQVGGTSVSGARAAGSVTIPNVKAGDTISVRSDQTTTLEATGNISISLISGPSSIAATETIAARYYASSTSVSGSYATVSWTTKDYDTHGAMSAGTFTVPATGKYQINAQLSVGASYTFGSGTYLAIFKNGVEVSLFFNSGWATGTTNQDTGISDIINCVAGDLITIKVKSDATTPSIVSSNTRNFVAISRIGMF